MKAILFDDNPDDCRLIARELRQKSPDIDITPISDMPAFQEALDEGGFDLAITEYQLEWANGLSVLIAIKNRYPECPVIFFTGSGGEEVAVEAMKLGVDDYLPKTREGFAHLGAAIEEALKRSDEFHQEQAFSGPSKGVYEAVPIGLYRLSTDLQLIDANHALVKILGYTDRGSLINRPLAEHFSDPKDFGAWLEILQKYRECNNFETQMRRRNGDLIWVWSSTAAVQDSEGRIQSYEGSLKDISEQVKNTNSLHEAAERLGILREIDQAILGTSTPEEIARATLKRIQQLVPCERGSLTVFELDGRQATVFATYGKDKSQFGTGSLILPESFGDIEELQRGETIHIKDLSRIVSPPAWVESLSSEGIRSYLKVPLLSQGRLIGSLNLEAVEPGVFNEQHIEYARDIASSLAIAVWQAKLTEQIHLLAITDELTGLYNRRQFFDLGRREFERAVRYDRPLSAIMLDLDHFKQVNDTYGHAVGDQVLRVVAQRCKKEVREIDILGRYGGEEFAILLPETHIDFGQVVAERLRRQMADFPIHTDRQILQVTVSLGITQANPATSDVSVLLEQADAAMYMAKQTGRDRVVAFQNQPG